MGFLEREAEEKRRLAQEEAAKAEQNHLCAAQEAADLLKVEEDLSNASEDNQRIAELLDNLPKFDIREYLRLVERHSGYTSELCLYTRASKVLASDELANSLSKLGLEAEWSVWETPEQGDDGVYSHRSLRTVHPKYMFYGVDVNPKKGFLGLTPIAESQEPGIGLHFAKHIKTTSLGTARTKYLAADGKYYNGDLYARSATITDHVFVRFVLPLQAIITGDGVRIDVTDLNTFDDALGYGFKYPHQTRTISSTREFTGGFTG